MRLSTLLRPTLARRVTLALLLAFAVVWLIYLILLYAQSDGRGVDLDEVNERLFPYLALSFVLILVPILVAVRQGLRPLRELSAHIARRGADDLSPLATPATYADLAPLTAALDSLMVQLRAKIERERVFVQDAAHELRTPLAAISAHAHALALAQDADGRAQAAQHLDRSVARASHLITQLLDLARMGGAPPRVQTVDMARTVRDELALHAPAAMARQIDITLDAPPTLMCDLDRDAFVAIVSNLVGNAVRYGGEGGTVSVQLQASGTQWRLSVEDDGPGIAPQARPQIFERFHRASDAASGSGLGLAIVRAAAQRLACSVRLDDSGSDHGCRFVVETPQGQLAGARVSR